MANYNIGICCLQETKVTTEIERVSATHRLILFPGQQRHYGLGFAINKYWQNRLVAYAVVSDRIAKTIFSIGEKSKLVVINI
jgi:hypothetical protein